MIPKREKDTPQPSTSVVIKTELKTVPAPVAQAILQAYKTSLAVKQEMHEKQQEQHKRQLLQDLTAIAARNHKTRLEHGKQRCPAISADGKQCPNLCQKRHQSTAVPVQTPEDALVVAFSTASSAAG